MKKMIFISTIVLVIFIVISSSFMLGTNQSTQNNTTVQTLTNQTELKGVSLSPRSFQKQDFTDFFDKSKKVCDIISWTGDWNELFLNSSAPFILTNLSLTYNYLPLVEVQFFNQSNGFSSLLKLWACRTSNWVFHNVQ